MPGGGGPVVRLRARCSNHPGWTRRYALYVVAVLRRGYTPNKYGLPCQEAGGPCPGSCLELWWADLRLLDGFRAPSARGACPPRAPGQSKAAAALWRCLSIKKSPKKRSNFHCICLNLRSEPDSTPDRRFHCICLNGVEFGGWFSRFHAICDLVRVHVHARRFAMAALNISKVQVIWVPNAI
jgi:hypothetical protein